MGYATALAYPTEVKKLLYYLLAGCSFGKYLFSNIQPMIADASEPHRMPSFACESSIMFPPELA